MKSNATLFKPMPTKTSRVYYSNNSNASSSQRCYSFHLLVWGPEHWATTLALCWVGFPTAQLLDEITVLEQKKKIIGHLLSRISPVVYRIVSVEHRNCQSFK